MKYYPFIILSIISSSLAYGAEVLLSTPDQERLAELIARFPLKVRTIKRSPLNNPLPGIKIVSEFPKYRKGVTFICESDYYNGSSYPSSSRCEVKLYEDHSNVDVNYDEYLVSITDPLITQALFNHISYGRPDKEFRSEGRDNGVDFYGKFGWVLHYYFKCSSLTCDLRFSRINKSDGR